MSRKATEATTRENSWNWNWSRTSETKRVMLEAAREVFVEQGFADASVAAVVERAGSSIGSLYHHFGGKSELFLALWELYQGELEHSAATAVHAARDEGERDTLQLFVLGSRVYLEEAWHRRDLERLFFDGDAPPAFESVRRVRAQEWIRQNSVLLGTGTDAASQLTVAVLSRVIGEAAREISHCTTKRQANRFIDAAEELIRRLDPRSAAPAPHPGR